MSDTKPVDESALSNETLEKWRLAAFDPCCTDGDRASHQRIAGRDTKIIALIDEIGRLRHGVPIPVSTAEIRVGDWVRFVGGNEAHLLIGEVMYIPDQERFNGICVGSIVTDLGWVQAEAIREVRRCRR